MQFSGGFLHSVGAWHMRIGCAVRNVAAGEAPDTANRKQMVSRKQCTAVGPSSSGPSAGDSAP